MTDRISFSLFNRRWLRTDRLESLLRENSFQNTILYVIDKKQSGPMSQEFDGIYSIFLKCNFND